MAKNTPTGEHAKRDIDWHNGMTAADIVGSIIDLTKQIK